jgi:hypothetical protein
MAERKSWFLVMTPAVANRSEARWLCLGALSRGSVVTLPTSAAGLGGACRLYRAAGGGGAPDLVRVASGGLSLAVVLLTIVVEAVMVAAFIMHARARGHDARLPPRSELQFTRSRRGDSGGQDW